MLAQKLLEFKQTKEELARALRMRSELSAQVKHRPPLLVSCPKLLGEGNFGRLKCPLWMAPLLRVVGLAAGARGGCTR